MQSDRSSFSPSWALQGAEPLGVWRQLSYILDMKHLNRRHFLFLAGVTPLTAWAEGASPFEPVPAVDVSEADLIFVRRPVVVFADTPNDPAFIRQMELLARYFHELEQRDVILITDTDPAARSELRQRLRPRGFSLVLMDKDWSSTIRKPLPWDGREVVNAIDKMPITRSESLEKSPAGR
ncbi:DUF4174 domain-containing protein [Xinfangfangia sp. CPCC 101601]|uniref:DUF4174 domain-containing protein n=1 Tax=Pseudogemmobacter lacusdianii TaxID=3069608 RepID=A0ABU0VVD8_9RHOB|nr:DUF4174 domain-containing protein [Xinfangfangia sp. CPCC 101601]MDQ2064935.1 DUF4174 domain-containing protein [Xinfangfangia sp. CPCC 101601]